MGALRRLWSRWLEWRRPGAVDADADAELRSHLEFLIDDHLKKGLTAEAARRAALLELGGLDQARSLSRDARGFRFVDALTSDVRLALRQLRHSPGFTVAALLTLALGVGANTAIFSVVDAVMLRPLPYGDPDRLMTVWEEARERPSVPGEPGAGTTAERIAVAPANMADYAERSTQLSSLAAYTAVGSNLTGTGRPERLTGEAVSANYFSTLAVRPAVGRPFLTGEDTEGRGQVVVISHALWQRRFAGRSDALGQSLNLDGVPYDVVGVMPRDFVGVTQPEQSNPVSFWMPLVLDSGSRTGRMEHIVQVVGRLAEGASEASAQAEIEAISSALASEFPEMANIRAALGSLRADQVSGVRAMLLVLVSAVGLVLLVACVNVAGLLLVRAVGRRREMAVRFALGASRSRVVLEQGVQSLVLATAGGVAGLLLGAAAIRLLVATAPASVPHIQDASADGRVLLFTGAVVVLTAMVFGIWPAMQAARVDPLQALKDGARGASEGWVVRRRSALLMAEVAMTAVVLAGAVLMIRSLMALDRVDLGFDPSHVVAASVALPGEAYPTPQSRLEFFQALESRLITTPGITSVAFGNRLPLRGNWISGMVLDAEEAFREAGFQAVNVDYFSTFGIPLVRGRALADTDRTGSPGVVLVNEAFGRVVLEGGDPIGHTIRRAPGLPAMTIVGVVGDVRRTGRLDASGTKAADVVPQVYLPAAQVELYPLPLREIALRTTPTAVGVAEAIRTAVIAIDPDQPVTSARTLDETLALGSAQKRFQATLFMLFGGVAFGLALVGVYGVVAYGVSQRSGEIALRFALGATRVRIVASIARQTAALVAVGVAVGLTTAVVASRLVSSLVFEVAPTDAATYVLTGLSLLAAGVAAGTLAGLRATHVNPLAMLR